MLEKVPACAAKPMLSAGATAKSSDIAHDKAIHRRPVILIRISIYALVNKRSVAFLRL